MSRECWGESIFHADPVIAVPPASPLARRLQMSSAVKRRVYHIQAAKSGKHYIKVTHRTGSAIYQAAAAFEADAEWKSL